MRRLENKLADSHAPRGREVDLVGVLDRPSGRLELPVDLAPGAGLGRQVRFGLRWDRATPLCERPLPTGSLDGPSRPPQEQGALRPRRQQGGRELDGEERGD